MLGRIVTGFGGRQRWQNMRPLRLDGRSHFNNPGSPWRHLCDSLAKPALKAMARGRAPTGGQINAIVLAFKAAISQQARPQTKKRGNLALDAAAVGQVWPLFVPLRSSPPFQGFNLRKKKKKPRGKKNKLTWLPFHQISPLFGF